MTEKEKERISPIEYLRILRDDYSDEIPNKVLNGSMPRDQIKYKVRRNWWNGLVGGLSRVQEKGLISNELQEDVTAFLEHYTSEEFHNQPLTTAEDIQKANNLLNKILGSEL